MEAEVVYSVPSEYDHQLDPSQIILFKGTIEFRKLSGSSREWSYSESKESERKEDRTSNEHKFRIRFPTNLVRSTTILLQPSPPPLPLLK